MSGSYQRGLAMAEDLAAKGIAATVDPRSATPPCVLITPPAVTISGYCSGAADWQLYALAPATANADAWKALDELSAVVTAVLPVLRQEFVAYSLSPDSPPLPAYRFTFTEGVDWA